MEKTYCHVAVNSPFNNSILTYLEGEYAGKLFSGMLVKVPLGKRLINGCVLDVSKSEQELQENVSEFEVKDVAAILTAEISLEKLELELYQWIAGYYHYPLGQLIFDCLPKMMARPRKMNHICGDGNTPIPDLTPEQLEIAKIIGAKLHDGFSKWLVHGVTGSGKTIIYLNLIQKILKEEKSILFLLPEINLTPQFLKMFSMYLNIPIYTYNSSITASEKYGLWKFLQNDGAPKIIIGVRSSIYLPIRKLGLIVVDEEHDQSFKQEDRCTYNARDVAIKKASMLDIPVVMGSATPCLETFNSQKYGLEQNYLTLRKRIDQVKLPKITLVDLREQMELGGFQEDMWPFTKLSLDKLEAVLEKGEQALVFVNRLGYANYLQCRACGHQFHCPNCSLNLKYFRKKKILSCQYCDYQIPIPQICPACSNMKLLNKGYGTERLHLILQNRFSDKIIKRFDRDDITTFKKLNERLDQFHAGEIDILVGTQMLSKGHNFKKVNLVLVFGVDSQLNFPDFRSNERVYQLLTQVGGRSGRFGQDSEVLIHTLGVSNSIYQYVMEHSFDEFYSSELELRKLCNCPPFCKLIMIYFSSKSQNNALEAGNSSVFLCRELCRLHFSNVEVLGPRPALVEKKVNKFTWVMMFRSDDINQLHNLLASFKRNVNLPRYTSIKIDVDPYNLR
ncbi:MAG: primosomal protein N' [Bacteriovoracaceae bacterium]|nr:primosomal protein N' [Bacteriovoracaceae bacterium]